MQENMTSIFAFQMVNMDRQDMYCIMVCSDVSQIIPRGYKSIHTLEDLYVRFGVCCRNGDSWWLEHANKIIFDFPSWRGKTSLTIEQWLSIPVESFFEKERRSISSGKLTPMSSSLPFSKVTDVSVNSFTFNFTNTLPAIMWWADYCWQ
jgi:hypothetical protein